MEFWVSIGSTYTYLTVSRIEAAADAAGVSVTWRPFNVRTMMLAQSNIPFAGKPAKTTYMWRDIERRSDAHGLPVTVPAPYPIDDLPLANQLALLGIREGWGIAYIKETYRRWFVEGQAAGSEPNMRETLTGLGLNADTVLAQAQSAEIVSALEDATEEAVRHGLFGAPSFRVGNELFWGDDRLEEALAWAQR